MRWPTSSFLLAPLAACALSHELTDAPLDSGLVSDTGVEPDASLECVAPRILSRAGSVRGGSGTISRIDGRTITVSGELDVEFTWVADELPRPLAVGDEARVTVDGNWSTLTTDRVRIDAYNESGFVPRDGTTTTSPSNGPFSLVERCRGASDNNRCGGPVVYDLAFRDSVRLGAGESSWTGCDGGGEIVFPGAVQYPSCTMEDDGLIVIAEADFFWAFGIWCADDSVSVD